MHVFQIDIIMTTKYHSQLPWPLVEHRSTRIFCTSSLWCFGFMIKFLWFVKCKTCHFGLQTSFQNLLKKQGGKRATWEYPFAVAGVNITFMIMQMLELHSSKPDTFFSVLSVIFYYFLWNMHKKKQIIHGFNLHRAKWLVEPNFVLC